MDLQTIDRKPGEFQQPPTLAEIEALCRRLSPSGELPATIVEVGGGMFNHTFLMRCPDGRKCVLRVSPPHDHHALLSNERHLLRRECALAPALAPVLGERLPRIVATDFSGEIVGRDAVLSTFVEGDNWHAVKDTLTPEQNDAVWRELGALVRRIHDVPGEPGQFGWPDPEVRHATWSGFVLHTARGLMHDYGRLAIDDTEPRAWLGSIEDGLALLDQVTEPRLVHGDPWPKNVLVQREGDAVRITGLLDQERGLWGDPMDEWVFHLLDFPSAFWEGYGPRPEGPAAEYRACVYRGLILQQGILEAWRFGWDATGFRRGLIACNHRMRQIIVESGLS